MRKAGYRIEIKCLLLTRYSVPGVNWRGGAFFDDCIISNVFEILVAPCENRHPIKV